MTATLSIGEFSRLTHLSVKTLRHYHDVRLLVPAGVDSESRYRRYAPAQAAEAQLIRRLRALDMPIEMVRTVVATVDGRARRATIAAHLEAMEAELERTKDVVASLRELLEQPARVADVERRRLPPQTALAIAADVTVAHVEHWCGAAFGELRDLVAASGAEVDGPAGGLFSAAFFTEDIGPVTVYVPVRSVPRAPGGRAEVVELPAGEVLVATHHGPYADLDRTYAVVGAAANELGLAGDGAIRELYVVGPDATGDPHRYRTEVCWPIVDAA
jgi:DNA-binding transcriptional MerR regulator